MCIFVTDCIYYTLINPRFLRTRDGEKFLKKKRKPEPPLGLKIHKGFKNVILRRDFVHFITQHPVAKILQTYLQDTRIPDEHYYATLSRIESIEPDAKTVYKVNQDLRAKKRPMIPGLCQRISLWRFPKCNGQDIRQICHLGVEDLAVVDRRNRMKAQ